MPQAPQPRTGSTTLVRATIPTDPDWAWAPYQPSGDRPWNLLQAGHLLRRAGFGGTWGELQRALSDGPQRTVDRLLSPEADVAAFHRTQDDYESAAAVGGSTQALRAWWVRRMIGTPHPLLEKMTLFWHDHFATRAARVQDARLTLEHIRLLRSHALGRFSALLEGIVTDRAVLLTLGADAGRKASPSEYFARRLLDRFTLGEGVGTDRDVREAARAFTGWFVLRGERRYFEREYDDGSKTVLGHTGNFDGAAVLRILLEQPATAHHIVRRLYRWFISETEVPPDDLLDPLARSFAADFDVQRLVGTLLRSNLFYADTAYRRKVKRPVEFAVGTIRALEGTVATLPLANDLATLGEDLCDPPTVDGWAGGADWINPSTIVGRSNLALALIQGSGPYGKNLDPGGRAAKHGHTNPESAGKFLVDLLLQGDVPESVLTAIQEETSRTSGSSVNRIRSLTHQIITLPEYQLA